MSLFRRKSGVSEKRIQTWYDLHRINRLFIDRGLSSGTTYTNYLRNGTSVNSELLGRAVCETKPEKEVGDLTILKTARNETRDSAWGNSVTAAPGDNISFLITIKATNGDVEDVSVRDVLPEKMRNPRNLKVNGLSVSGDITSELSLGDVSVGEPQVITFNAQLFGEDSFGAGWTNLVNRAYVLSKGAQEAEDTAEIYVSKGVVAGAATRIPAGITNNKLIDFVLLPLLATLIIWLLFKKHFIALSGWIERKKFDAVDFKAKKNLEKVTSRIKMNEK